MSRYLVCIVMTMGLLIQCKNDKNEISDGELFILLYSTYQAPDPACVNPGGSGYTLLSSGVTKSGIGHEDFYFPRTSSTTRFTITLQQAGCSVQRSYIACKGGYSQRLTASANTSGITCSDGTVDTSVAISGGVGVTEVCTINRTDDLYRAITSNFGTSCNIDFLAENL